MNRKQHYDYQGRKVDSSWEANFSRTYQLPKNFQSFSLYQFSSQRKIVSYTPDFIVDNGDTWIEIKGNSPRGKGLWLMRKNFVIDYCSENHINYKELRLTRGGVWEIRVNNKRWIKYE